MRICRNVNAVLETRFRIWYQALLVSSVMKPLVSMKERALMMPSNRPEATMAGMMGTKTSPRSLIARMNGLVCCCAAASLTSALVAAVMWPRSMNSS